MSHVNMHMKYTVRCYESWCVKFGDIDDFIVLFAIIILPK